MPLSLLIHHEKEMRESARRYFESVRGYSAVAIEPPRVHSKRDGTWFMDAFHLLADRVDAAAGGPQALREAVAVIDLWIGPGNVPGGTAKGSVWSGLNPLGTYNEEQWLQVVAALVLAFPEIHWAFHTASATAGREKLSRHFALAHLFGPPSPEWPLGSLGRITDLLEDGHVPLFDPTGLRDLIHRNISKTSAKPPEDPAHRVASHVPERREHAVVIDEEVNYCYLLGYTAYKFGYLCHSISTYTMLKRLLGTPDEDRQPLLPEGQPSLVFEDVYLDFSDREPGENLIDLERRERAYPGNQSRFQYVVIETGGSGGDLRTSATNKAYIETLEREKRGRVVMKPLPGVYDLWEKSGVWSRRENNNGRGAGYRYPFVPVTTTPAPTGHSAPGRLLEIADRLLQRARTIAGSAGSVPEAVHGAVLALEAQELLGCQNPTTVLEALAIQHELEVVAECQSFGVESSTTLGRRFDDIKTFVDATKAAFGERNRDHAADHARAGLINRLVLRFRDAARFDEENECLNQARLLSLGSRLYFRPLQWFKWYLYRSVGSLRFLTLCTLVWIVVFSIALYGFEVGLGSHAPDPMHWLQWLCYSALTMIGLGTPDMGVVFSQAPRPLHPIGILVTIVAATITGFVHIGILVSALYSRLARR